MQHAEQILRLPFQDLRKLLVGFAFFMVNLISVLSGWYVTGFILTFLAALFVIGYNVRVAQNSTTNFFTLPDWTNLPAYFLDGLTFAGIAAIWGLPAIILCAVTLGPLSIIAFLSENYGVLYTLWGSIVALLALLAWYVIPASVLTYYQNKSLSDAFDLARLLSIVTRPEYASNWGLAFATWIILGIMMAIGKTFLGNITPILAVLFVALVNTIQTTYLFAWYGQAYAQAGGRA